MRKVIVVVIVTLLLITMFGCGSKALKVTENSQRFLDWGYDVSLQGGANYRPESFGEYDAMVNVLIIQYVGVKDLTFYDIQQVSAKNIKITKQPKAMKITPTLEDLTGTASSIGKDSIAWTGSNYDGRIRLTFASNTIGTHILGESFSGRHSASWAFLQVVNNKALKSDDLRFTVSYQLEIIDIHGKKFYKDIMVEVLPGDFLRGPSTFEAYYVYKNDYAEPFKE